MNPDRLIAGLDIGSARTTAVIAEAVGERRNTPTLRILALAGGERRASGAASSPTLRRRTRIGGKGRAERRRAPSGRAVAGIAGGTSALDQKGDR